MKTIARKITIFFINKGKIPKEDLDSYEYCFEMLLSTIFNTCILIIGAIITKRYYETIIFSIAFIVIRRCIGGYHAKSHIGCFSLLLFMYITMNLMLLINYKVLNIISIILNPICLIIISILAPVSHPNNPLDENKINKLNKIAIVVSAIYCVICIFFKFFLSKKNISILITIPFTFSTLSMVIGYFKYRKCIS